VIGTPLIADEAGSDNGRQAVFMLLLAAVKWSLLLLLNCNRHLLLRAVVALLLPVSCESTPQSLRSPPSSLTRQKERRKETTSYTATL